MVARDGVEPPTRGFSDLNIDLIEFNQVRLSLLSLRFLLYNVFGVYLSLSKFGTLGTHLAHKVFFNISSIVYYKKQF